MNIADERKRGRAAALTGLLPRGFRLRPALLAGSLTVTGACALAGCSAAGTATDDSQHVALSAQSSMAPSMTPSGMAPSMTPSGMAPSMTPSGMASSMTPSMTPVVANIAGALQVVTLNNRRDLTFNQLLGINNAGVIVGYFGSGDAGHPNKGYALTAPYAQGDFSHENFPGSAQTQITGLNDKGISVGFFSPTNAQNAANNSNIAFWRWNGRYHKVSFPTRNNAKPVVDQLLGVNDTGTAVGFYNDGAGNAHGYAYNLRTGRFKMIMVPGATSVTAAAVNNGGATVGFFTSASGAVDAFLQYHHGRTVTIAVPGASMTQAFGVNDAGEVVGAYTTGKAENAVSHGFTWKNGMFTTVDYPMSSATFINGVNDEGDIVGFYTDAKGNTDGFVGLP